MKLLEFKLRNIIKQELIEALADNGRLPGLGKAVTDDPRNLNLRRTDWEARQEKQAETEKAKEELMNDDRVASVASTLNDIQKHNFLILYENYHNVNTVKKMVEEIPPLRDKKIRRKIATGTQGVVYSLEGRSLLKLYEGSYLSDVDGENARYSKLKDVSFSGSGALSDLLVYDNGVFNSPSRFAKKIGWVEMGKVIVLVTYFQIINNFDSEKVQKSIDAYSNLYALMSTRGKLMKNRDFNSIEEAYNSDFFVENIRNNQRYLKSEKVLGSEFVEKIIKGMLKVYFDNDKNVEVFNDMHEGNVGILNLHNPVPVFFDL